MPTAAVQQIMVNTQPQYVVGLFGKGLQLASATVPTSKGLLELHSGKPEMSGAQNTVVAVSNTAVTITVSSVRSTATSKDFSAVTCMVSDIQESGKKANLPS